METLMETPVGSMNSVQYKQYHESYMQNNHGSTHFHVFLCIIFTVQCSIIVSIHNKYTGIIQYVFEYLVIVLPLICIHTVLADYIHYMNLILFVLLCCKVLQSSENINKKLSEKNIFLSQSIHCISNIRGLTYIITGFCILAVDFKQFPRHLAKTENYGYSLMDTGVGLFVLISGLVHKDLNQNNYKSVLKGNFKLIFILLVLGVSRLVMIKQLDYQEHVTEYGTHWNFFFTLAICKFLSSFLLLFSNKTLVLSIILIVTHEIFLFVYLQEWVFGLLPRNNIIDANREGISSCLGYVSLYMFAVHLKTILTNRSLKRSQVMIFLFSSSSLLWILSYITHKVLPTSRTLANAGYCLYLESILTTVLLVTYYFQVLFENRTAKYDVPKILQAMNKNGLIYFLITNLVTGAVNMSTRTLLCAPLVTFLLLNCYMIATVSFTLYLDVLKFKL